jgi:hypothetical protein
MPEFEGRKSNDKEKGSARSAASQSVMPRLQVPAQQATGMSHTQASSIVAAGTGTSHAHKSEN